MAETCKGKKADGADCAGKDTGNGYCRHHQDQATNGKAGKVTPITAAKSAAKPAAGSVAPAASKPAATPKPILKGQISDAGLQIQVSKLASRVVNLKNDCTRLAKRTASGGQPGYGAYGTLRDQLEDYASICSDMENEIKKLLE